MPAQIFHTTGGSLDLTMPHCAIQWADTLARPPYVNTPISSGWKSRGCHRRSRWCTAHRSYTELLPRPCAVLVIRVERSARKLGPLWPSPHRLFAIYIYSETTATHAGRSGTDESFAMQTNVSVCSTGTSAYNHANWSNRGAGGPLGLNCWLLQAKTHCLHREVWGLITLLFIYNNRYKSTQTALTTKKEDSQNFYIKAKQNTTGERQKGRHMMSNSKYTNGKKILYHLYCNLLNVKLLTAGIPTTIVLRQMKRKTPDTITGLM